MVPPAPCYRPGGVVRNPEEVPNMSESIGPTAEQLERIRTLALVNGAVAQWGQLLLASRTREGRAALDAAKDFDQATRRLTSDSGETSADAADIHARLLAMASKPLEEA